MEFWVPAATFSHTKSPLLSQTYYIGASFAVNDIRIFLCWSRIPVGYLKCLHSLANIEFDKWVSGLLGHPSFEYTTQYIKNVTVNATQFCKTGMIKTFNYGYRDGCCLYSNIWCTGYKILLSAKFQTTHGALLCPFFFLGLAMCLACYISR